MSSVFRKNFFRPSTAVVRLDTLPGSHLKSQPFCIDPFRDFGLNLYISVVDSVLDVNKCAHTALLIASKLKLLEGKIPLTDLFRIGEACQTFSGSRCNFALTVSIFILSLLQVQ